MRIKKIYEDRYVCCLYEDDFDFYGIDLKEFKYNTLESEELFNDIINKINEIISDDESYLMVSEFDKKECVFEMIPFSDLLMVIVSNEGAETKNNLDDFELLDSYEELHQNKIMYKFKNLDNVINLARIVKGNFEFCNSLYLYNDELYLGILALEDEIFDNGFIRLMADYSDEKVNYDFMIPRIHSKGKILIKKNALQMLQDT